MSRSDRVIKTTIIYFIGNFASKLLGFVLLPLYTAYLTTADFGFVDVLISALPLIAPLFTMQVTESVFRFLITDQEDLDKKKTITNALGIFVIGMLIFLLVYIPIAAVLKIQYGGLFLIYFLATYIGIFLQQILRGLQRTMEYAITGVISTVVHAVLNIYLLVRVGLGGESLLLSSVSGSLVISVFIALRTKIWLFVDFKQLSKLEINKQLKFGIPLIPSQIAWWMIGLFGKYILLYFHGAGDNGLLAVANKFPNLVTIVNSIIIKAWVENIIAEFDSEGRDEFFNSGFTAFTVFTISMSAVLLPIIKIYIELTIGGEYADVWKYVPVLMIGSLFNSLATFLSSVYFASMKTKQDFITTSIGAISNLILSFALIPWLSIWGVVMANVLSFTILYLVRINSVKAIINYKVDVIKLLPSLSMLIISIAVYFILNITWQFATLLILGITTLYLNKNMVLYFFSFVKFNIVKKKS